MQGKTATLTRIRKAVWLLAIGGVAALAMPASAQLVEVRQKVLGMD